MAPVKSSRQEIKEAFATLGIDTPGKYTSDQIRKAFRMRVLSQHTDKVRASDAAAAAAPIFDGAATIAARDLLLSLGDEVMLASDSALDATKTFATTKESGGSAMQDSEEVAKSRARKRRKLSRKNEYKSVNPEYSANLNGREMQDRYGYLFKQVKHKNYAHQVFIEAVNAEIAVDGISAQEHNAVISYLLFYSLVSSYANTITRIVTYIDILLEMQNAGVSLNLVDVVKHVSRYIEEEIALIEKRGYNPDDTNIVQQLVDIRNGVALHAKSSGEHFCLLVDYPNLELLGARLNQIYTNLHSRERDTTRFLSITNRGPSLEPLRMSTRATFPAPTPTATAPHSAAAPMDTDFAAQEGAAAGFDPASRDDAWFNLLADPTLDDVLKGLSPKKEEDGPRPSVIRRTSDKADIATLGEPKVGDGRDEAP